ncbi:hypothetical protein MW887_005271 [Aspergillus wentii]|nr:hypothetical protein MW887_005271 [Aspergillus wentii]
MHRRAVLELSRRQGVDLSCATRHRAAFSPVPAYVPRRSFRSPLANYNSSDSPSTPNGDGDGDGTASHPSFPGSKFGGSRWANKQAQPAGLSPAEQAMRNALVARNNEQQKAQQAQQAHKEQQNPKPRGDGPRWGNKQAPKSAGLSPAEQAMRDALVAKNTQQQKTQEAQQNRKLRGDGDRPERQQNPFATRGRSRSTNNDENDFKFRKLGHEMKLEFGEERAKRPDAPRNKRDDAFRGYASREGLFSGPRIVFKGGKEVEAQTKETPKHKDVDHKQPEKPQKPTPKKAEPIQDEWSWDLSSLKQIEMNAQDTPTTKAPKRRDGRKQREANADEDEGDFDADDRRKRREERRRLKKEKTRQKEKEKAKELDSTPSPLYLPEFISVSNLADVIGVRPAQFVRRMEEMGFEDVSYSHVLDAETAGLVATEFNFEPIFETADEDLTAAPEPEDKSSLPPRPPVVTIMGHVDHGKTTILDWLRNSSVAASEHGGITQHIGAFSVPMPSGKTITFLDTPGHAAFLEMRRRGADVTDIVVLVVAADDSVKPQTIEAIKHATQSKVPVIVAMSKIDKENVNTDKVKQDLSIHGVHVEDYGGDVQAIGVSGKTGQGMLDLEEAIVTLSEVLDHRAEVTGHAEGWVIEGTTKSYGRVATVLIKRGTLRVGDVIVAGSTWARVRTLRNEAGITIDQATPGMPVEVDGWREQPTAGTELLQAENEQQAKDVVEYRLERTETRKLGEDTAAINEARREALERRRQEESDQDGSGAEQEASGPKPVNFIIKADVGGSAEAVLNSVTAIGNNEVFANVLRSSVGPISEFDIEHAASANGHLISFNQPIDPAMLRMAEARGVGIMDYNIIYKLIDEVKGALSEHLAPTITQRVTGEAEIGQIFEITLKGREKTSIAGCKVRNGMVNRAKKVRVLRGQETVYDGSITSLKNVKKDVTEMRKDTECGIGFEGWTDFAVGDHIQCYEDIYEKRYL